MRDRETLGIRDRDERQGRAETRSRHRKRQIGMEEDRGKCYPFSTGPWVPGVGQVSEPRMVGRSLFPLCPTQGSQSCWGGSDTNSLEVPWVEPRCCSQLRELVTRPGLLWKVTESQPWMGSSSLSYCTTSPWGYGGRGRGYRCCPG